MKACTKVLGSLALVLAGLGLDCPSGIAQTADPAESLHYDSIPEVVDRNTRIDTYFQDDSTLGDGKFFFGVEFSDRTLVKSGRQIEALYRDLLQQQDEDYPTLRTRDLPNPFNSSLSEIQPSAGFLP
ncbi:hypothetical protein [Lyngbya confervoides]|uniref:Uncharacterized protein n=1 Tax=Lyngbya confervoides BDU141951 TaxID=1574623 RepID=A0ABD4T2D9_9CYAN|nr:hypothetical protein [Lyngbya confervoides]MCM1982926.1 hypothetical protein [Lyngbya confervoides BDU141951]